MFGYSIKGEKMVFVWDITYVVNLVLCIIILVLGILGYSKNKITLYIGIAFGLFGLSHIATIAGLKATLEGLLIGIRTLAYVLVIIALYKLWKK